MTTEHEKQQANHHGNQSGSTRANNHNHHKSPKWSKIAWQIMVLIGVIMISIVVLIMWTLQSVPLNEPQEGTPGVSVPVTPDAAELTQEAAQ